MTLNRFALVFIGVLLCDSVSEAVNYRVTFDATWSATNHPNAYPGTNAHFSTPIGTTHNSDVTFWAPGELATKGIEGMAETGSVRVMREELAAAMDAGNAFGFIQGGTFNSPSSRAIEFEAIDDYSQVSLVSMIAPSPDWFVGVHGLELRDANGWIPQIIVPLAPYDAGTEQGTGFSTNNPGSNPPENIRRLDTDASSVLFETAPFGTFTFDLLPPCDLNFDDQCNAIDLNSETGLYSAGDLTAGVPVTLGVTSKFDLNGDSVIDTVDLEVWLADAAALNGFAEPYLKGDTNLNDHVGFGDFTALSAGFGLGSEWTDGNYDGNAVTNFEDFLALSKNFGKSIRRQPAPVALPEPSGNFMPLLVAVTVLLSCRKSGI